MTNVQLTKLPELPGIRINITGAPTPGGTVFSAKNASDLSKLAKYGQADALGGWDEGGNYVFYVDLVVGTNPGDGGVTATATNLIPGNKYTASVDVSVGAVAPNFRLDAVGYGSSAPSAQKGVWENLAYTFIAESETVTLRLVNAGGVSEYSGTSFDNMTIVTVSPDPISITRVDAGGSVVIATGSPSNGNMTYTDTGMDLVGDVAYTVYDGWKTLPTQNIILGAVSPIIRVPSEGVMHRIDMITNYEANRTGMSSVHQIIGRPEPVVILRPLTMRRGTIAFWFVDAESAMEVENLANMSKVMVLVVPEYPHMDMSFIAESTSLIPDPEEADSRRWIVTMQYVEVE